MKFYDMVYGKYGSIRGYLSRKFINEGKEKLEKASELYEITKGINIIETIDLNYSKNTVDSAAALDLNKNPYAITVKVPNTPVTKNDPLL